ncbi:MAG TPA: MBL fold metallo-hydrolase [Planctomycetaceae bacterium]|nr:MBL fold metallo-hydrolase [Planctomycetaceae bacterium]
MIADSWRGAGLLLLFSASVWASEPAGARPLRIYFLDMMGGASTLIVTPLGQSVLIDTGSLEPKHRDADRIFAAARHAGLKQIDYLVTTHFHLDHFGGILRVTELLPVRTFMDKGHPPPEHEQQTPWFHRLYPLYRRATGGRVRTLGPGDAIPLANDPSLPPLELRCVAAEKRVEGFDGDVDAPVSGFVIKPPDRSDNARSIALVLRYGRFGFFAGGDITWNVEHHLAWPRNRIGQVDLYQVTHHGLDQSNNPLLLRALDPVVAIAMNGPRKGIQPSTFRTLTSLRGLKDLYQIHYNTQYGDRGNAPRPFIANADDPTRGRWIRASVAPKADRFTVSIEPDGPSRTYAVR